MRTRERPFPGVTSYEQTERSRNRLTAKDIVSGSTKRICGKTFPRNGAMQKVLYTSIYLSIELYPSIYPSIFLSIHPAIYLSLSRPLHVSIAPAICLSIDLSTYLSIYLSFHLSIYPSIYLFIYLHIYLSAYLSVYLLNLSVYLFSPLPACLAGVRKNTSEEFLNL